jgi:hypothetical protein
LSDAGGTHTNPRVFGQVCLKDRGKGYALVVVLNAEEMKYIDPRP